MKLKTRKNKITKENNQKNFFNNQNYILGKIEKKKILTKFFTERYYIFFYKVFSMFYKYGFLFLITFTFVGTLLLILIQSLSDFSNGGVIGIIFSIGMGFLFYYSYDILLKRIDNGFFNVKNLKTFIIRKNSFSLFKTVINHLFKKNKFTLNNTLNILYIGIIPFIIFGFVAIFLSFFDFYIKIIIFIILLIIFDYVSLVSFLLLPILLGLNLLTFIYSIIYTFIFRGIKGYKIIKNIPKTKILTKFTKINEKFAENKYYKITIKN